MAYTYRFVDVNNRIIYIGKTVNIDRRIAEHFGGKGHLPKECYNSVARIEYQKHNTEADALIWETYYITLLSPKFNKLQKSRDMPTIEFKEKEWKLYKQLKNTNAPVKLNWNWFSIAWLMFLMYLIVKWLISFI
ncbi:MAG: nucleotide excision repair endonuclease [Peptostreptococcaceae bacterium]